MLYLLYRTAKIIVLLLPLKISYWLANILGSLYYFLIKKDRNIVINNIKVVLNHAHNSQDVCSASRMVFVNFARYLVEFFHTEKIDSRFIEKNIKIEGRENLDNALKLGKGVLHVSAHLGNWELGAMVVSMLGYKLNSVVWTHKNRLINEFFVKQRQSKGVSVIPLGIGVRKAFSALGNNEGIALLGDIDFINPEAGIEVKFFGHDTIMPKGPAEFSLRTGAPIVPTFMLREKDNKFRFVFEKPLIRRPSGNRDSDLAELTQNLTKVIEFYIGRYPEQWFMLRPRWQNKS